MYYSTTKLEFQMMYAVKIEVLTFFRQNSAGQDDEKVTSGQLSKKGRNFKQNLHVISTEVKNLRSFDIDQHLRILTRGRRTVQLSFRTSFVFSQDFTIVFKKVQTLLFRNNRKCNGIASNNNSKLVVFWHFDLKNSNFHISFKAQKCKRKDWSRICWLFPLISIFVQAFL